MLSLYNVDVGDRFKFQDAFPTGVTKFVKIAAMRSELIALGDNGFFYSWLWKNEGHGSLTAHPYSTQLLSNVSSVQVSIISLGDFFFKICMSSTGKKCAFLQKASRGL